jgi:hypothetical protein
LVTNSHVRGWNSKIPIICNTCGYGSNGEWNTCCINKHINSKRGCPNCSGRLRLTLERAYQVHQNKYNYSLITEAHIKTMKSKIHIICNVCGYGIEEPSARVDYVSTKSYGWSWMS